MMLETASPAAYPGRFLPDWLAHRAGLMPDRPALLADGQCWSFSELDRRATRAARRLAALGVRPGQPVALLARNGPAFVEAVHGLMRLGALLVPLNLRLTAPELAFQVLDVGAALLLHDAERADLARQVGTAAPGLVLAALESLPALAEADFEPRATIDLAADHCVVYTSGTTGQPKGARLTYGNHWWSAVGSSLNLGLHHDDRWLAVLPLFHVGGLSILLRGVIYGIPALVHRGFDPVAVNRAVDEDGVTIVSVVSAMLARLLTERGDRPYPPSLRCVLLGGGPAPEPLLNACAVRGVPVVQTYGLTETASQVATLAPADALRKLGSAGRPLLPTRLRVERDGAPAAAGQVGEILVQGPTVTPGYVNRPDATARALRNGWLHTGDLGYLDHEGYLYVLDRRDDLVITGGENVYPAEVEAVLLSHPAVEEAGVTGRPDPRWGQVPVAAVHPRPGQRLSLEDLQAFCRQRLAAYKTPVEILVVDHLPRNAAGKLLRRELRRLWTDSASPAEQP